MRPGSAPRQLATAEQLYAAALRALMRRAHSVYEMRQWLEGRAEDKAAVKEVLARLKERRYLDDTRYAQDFARQRAQSRRQGKFRIAQELRRRGVSDCHIEAALDAVFAETTETELLRARLRRKLSVLRTPLDQRKLASLYRSLLRAGFSADIIHTELRALRKVEVPEHNDAVEES